MSSVAGKGCSGLSCMATEYPRQQSSHGNRKLSTDFISVGAFAELENTSLGCGCFLPSLSVINT